MEDYTASTLARDHGFFGVFDGHSGYHAAEYVQRTLHGAIVSQGNWKLDIQGAMESAFVSTDERFLKEVGTTDSRLKNYGGGTCAVAAVVTASTVHIANVGDSRALLCRRDGSVVELTSDQTPARADERARIENAGGYVECGLVQGELPISRSIGDRRYKASADNAEAMYETFDVSKQVRDTESLRSILLILIRKFPYHRTVTRPQIVTGFPEMEVLQRRDTDAFILMASDGLWSVCSCEDAAAFVRERLVSGSQGAAQEAAEQLVNHATFELRSNDRLEFAVGSCGSAQLLLFCRRRCRRHQHY